MKKSLSQINQIKKLESPPILLNNFFQKTDIDKMISWSEQCFSEKSNCSQRLQDNSTKNNDLTGIPSGQLKLEICDFLHNKFSSSINKNNQLKIEFDIAFHANKKPYGIHTDSGYNPDEFIYKQGIIPLINTPIDKKTHTVLLKQKCYHSSSFPDISNNLEAQKDVYDLDFNNPIEANIYSKYWDQSKDRIKQMNGFTIEYPFEWNIGDTIIWDRSHIHCSSDFKATGVEFKLGLMWISRVIL